MYTLCIVYELSLGYFLAVLFICVVFSLGFLCQHSSVSGNKYSLYCSVTVPRHCYC